MVLYESEYVSGLYIIRKQEEKDILGSRDIVFSWRTLDEKGLAPFFKYDYDFYFTQKGEIAGLFYQHNQTTLIHCVENKVQVSIIDLRKTSSKYKESWNLTLNENKTTQLLITSGFAFGVISCCDHAIVNIKSTKSYQENDLIIINFMDPDLNLKFDDEVISLPEFFYADCLKNVEKLINKSY